MDKIIQKTKEIIISDSEEGLRQQLRKQVGAYLIAALGFVAGLAWNEAIKGIIEYVFPFNKDSLLAKLIYAFVITIVLIFVALYISKDKKQK